MRDDREEGLDPAVQVPGDVTSAEWLPPRLLPLGAVTRVGAIVPTGFEAYARILHPARDSRSGAVSWKAVADWSEKRVHPEVQWHLIRESLGKESEDAPWISEPEVGRCPAEVLTPLVEILASHTPHERRCWVCYWAGRGDLEEVMGHAPIVHHPERDYYLLRAPLGKVSAELVRVPLGPTPSICWPDDQSWCLATEVDFMWTYVAGPSALIERILAEPRLEALPTKPEHRGDHLSDELNGPA